MRRCSECAQFDAARGVCPRNIIPRAGTCGGCEVFVDPQSAMVLDAPSREAIREELRGER